MADDKTKRGGADRARVSGNEPYEVGYFAKKHGLSRTEAQKLIDRIGNDRAALDAAASEGKGSGSGPGAAAARPGKRSARGSKGSAAKPVPAVAATIDAVTEALIDPIAKATRPARRGVATATHKATDESRHVVEGTMREVAKAPATLKREARQTAKAVTTAASSRAASLVGAATVGLVAGVALGLNRKAITTATRLLGTVPHGDTAIGAHTTLAERIARVLAGTDASANADGDASSAGGVVDTRWRSHLPQAVSVLKTLRVPSHGMARNGDAQMWETMVLAAVAEAERV